MWLETVQFDIDPDRLAYEYCQESQPLWEYMIMHVASDCSVEVSVIRILMLFMGYSSIFFAIYFLTKRRKIVPKHAAVNSNMMLGGDGMGSGSDMSVSDPSCSSRN